MYAYSPPRSTPYPAPLCSGVVQQIQLRLYFMHCFTVKTLLNNAYILFHDFYLHHELKPDL